MGFMDAFLVRIDRMRRTVRVGFSFFLATCLAVSFPLGTKRSESASSMAMTLTYWVREWISDSGRAARAVGVTMRM